MSQSQSLSKKQQIQSYQQSQIQYEKAFNKSRCQEYIKLALSNMQTDDYDFCFSNQQKMYGKRKQMRRNGMYLRFKCLNCKQDKKEKRFTSTLGTVSIYFQFRELKQQRKYPLLLIFSLTIYRMKCRLCKKYGVPQIYDSQLLKIQKQFCKIIADILNKVQPKPRKVNGRPVPNLKIHQHRNCQACRLKKCHSGPC